MNNNLPVLLVLKYKSSNCVMIKLKLNCVRVGHSQSPIIVSSCEGNFYGGQCEVDGEVIVVAIGASVAAVFIIVLTLICLCMWR